jgi:hypothetical protein
MGIAWSSVSAVSRNSDNDLDANIRVTEQKWYCDMMTVLFKKRSHPLLGKGKTEHVYTVQ